MSALREALLRGRRRPRYGNAGSPALHRGDGYEFVELRAYVPGDDPRRIDWAATARTGALQQRVVLEEVALTLAAVVDDSASMRVGRRRALLDAATDARDAWFGAALADDRCIRVAGDGESSALEVARAMLPRGSALLVAGDFYDLRDDDEELLAALGKRCDCTALAARDPWRDDLPLRGFVRLRDAESGAAARFFVGRAERAAYRAAVRAREERLRERFESLGWRFGSFDEANGARGLYAAFGLIAAP